MHSCEQQAYPEPQGFQKVTRSSEMPVPQQGGSMVPTVGKTVNVKMKRSSTLSNFNPRGKHCFVTGGSQGLGLALAVDLASKGADVTICARTESKLEEALKQVEAARVSPTQKLHLVAADVSERTGAISAVERSASFHGGRAPEIVICAAGGSTPGFFLEQGEKEFEAGMKLNYWTAHWTCHAATAHMVRQGIKGKLVLVSSTLGFMSFVGWSQYAPSKYAVRGLADTLRHELLLHDISVHCYFPGTIKSPGYENEMLTKPELTKKIEGEDDALTPEECAKGMIKGLERGYTYITTDLTTDIIRTQSSGPTRRNSVILDTLLGFVGAIGLPIWRRYIDHEVRASIKQH